MDRELTRAELDELLPLYAIDALDGEEREQVARYVERDDAARAEVESLREAASFLPPPDVPAPTSLWTGIESSLAAPSPAGPPPPLLHLTRAPGDRDHAHGRSRLGRRVVALLAAAAIVFAVVLGIEVVRQRNRIDDLAAEMHRDPMEQQAMAARASADAHVIPLADMAGTSRRGNEVVMMPDGTGYLLGRDLPALGHDSTYQLWAKVGADDGVRMVSLGVLGRHPAISAFRLAATPSMFMVTRERASGSDTPGAAVVLRGDAA